MKTNIFKHVAIVLFLAGSFVSCGKHNMDLTSNDSEIFTAPFYVFSVSIDEQCGYLLFADLGSPGLFHSRFVYAENLPKEYQEYLLPVIVTFRKTERRCDVNEQPIINIIKIQKKQKSNFI